MTWNYANQRVLFKHHEEKLMASEDSWPSEGSKEKVHFDLSESVFEKPKHSFMLLLAQC